MPLIDVLTVKIIIVRFCESFMASTNISKEVCFDEDRVDFSCC